MADSVQIWSRSTLATCSREVRRVGQEILRERGSYIGRALDELDGGIVELSRVRAEAAKGVSTLSSGELALVEAEGLDAGEPGQVGSEAREAEVVLEGDDVAVVRSSLDCSLGLGGGSGHGAGRGREHGEVFEADHCA